jgi:hypothetical protein
MPRITCPHCKTALSVGEEARGTVLACPQCARRIRVPADRPAGIAPERHDKKSPPPDAVVPPPRVTTAPTTQPPAPRRRVPDDDEEQLPEDDAPAEGPSPSVGSKFGGAVGGVGALVFLALFLFVISGKWVTLFGDTFQKFLERQGIPAPVAIAATAVILIIPLGLFLASLTKSGVVGAMPDEVDFHETTPDAFPHHDAKRLAEYTAAFEALGFRHVTDYTAVMNLNNGVTGFARLLFHDEYRCFAEVNQGFSHGTPVPMRCMVISHLEDGWSVSTSDRQATKEFYAIRRPRALWRSLPGREPADLVEGHRKFRDKVAGELDLEVSGDGTAKAYFRREADNTRLRKDLVRRRNAVVLCAELWLFDRNPKGEWLGDYPRAARQKKR